jgi:hypothetical protein
VRRRRHRNRECSLARHRGWISHVRAFVASSSQRSLLQAQFMG